MWALVVLWTGLSPLQPAQTAAYSAHAVKAAFLYRFAGYVEWPEPSAPDGPFVIAVVGAGAVAEELRRLLPGVRIQNREAQVREVSSPRDLAGVQVLYVGPDHPGRARSLVAAARSRPVLLVTDERGGLESGGVINFVPVNGRVRFEISLAAAERSQLRITSGLLSVALRIEGAPE